VTIVGTNNVIETILPAYVRVRKERGTMTTVERYWSGVKFALRTAILWVIVFATGLGLVMYVVDFAGGDDVVKTLVFLSLTGVFLLKLGGKLKSQWPPSEERPQQSGESSGGSSGGVMGYECENCGKTLYDDLDVSALSSGYACGNCGHYLDDQVEADIRFGEEVWDDEDDGSDPAPWDDDYGDPAPWDDDYGDPAPWDDDYSNSAPWDDDDDSW
jgi:DNA-directed RNA polymerase subunit RPC12/RpoP